MTVNVYTDKNGYTYFKKRATMPDNSRPSITAKNSKDWAKKVKERYDNFYNNAPQTKHLDQLIISDELLEFLKEQTLWNRKKTVSDYKYLANHLLNSKFASTKMTEIDTQYASRLANHVKTYTTVGIALRVIKQLNQVIQWHVDNARGLEANPIRKIVATNLRRELNKNKESDQLPVISIADVMACLDYFKDSPYIFPFHFMALHGMRVSESTAISWDDIDLDKNQIHVHQQVSNDGNLVDLKTKGSERYVPLEPVTKALLLEIPEEQRIGLIVTNRWGKACTGDNLRKSHFNKARKYLLEQNPDFNILTTHQFRKFYISYHIDRGTPIQTVSSRVGHADSSITLQIYTKTIKETSKFNADLMSGLFMDIKPQVISIKKDVRLSV